ncbi:MAG: hypothetical protein NWQ54_20085 [Paraglaciecola sp.]|uniref:hypothetical protein n=1 Tax=Alishewanella sp. HL-SH05 TaxID=3461145 RepID=UPI00274BBC98|nr:hypothetical protein [Paraglaciecola sp.]
MEAQLRIERAHAFVITEANLKKVWISLEENVGDVSAEVSFNDSIARKVKSFDELMSFENSKSKKINRIEVYGRSDSNDNWARILFSDSKYRPIEISATGEDRAITSFGDNITEVIDGLKPWYSTISKLEFFYIIGFICWFSFALLNIMIPDTPNNEPIELANGVKIILAGFGMIAAIVFSIWGLNRLRSVCFPVASFAIGQGLERHRVQENIRWGVVVAFVVSLFSSTVFAVLT